jgi:hypothetical protein
MTSINTLGQLKKLFWKSNVQVFYVKHLSKKQDNDKNQIYLGNSLGKLANLFPMKIREREFSSSTQKRKSNIKTKILEGSVDFFWIGRDSKLYPARDTKIIFYHQFPEVRMSGFLNNCSFGPDSLRRKQQAKYGKRILCFGVTNKGKVLGFVLTRHEDPVVYKFPTFDKVPNIPSLQIISASSSDSSTPWSLLKKELKSVFSAGWHKSQILKRGDSNPVPFNGTQGGGYTLESLLGISANSSKAPDKHGYEIKSFSMPRVSLMTPCPDIGFYGENTFDKFLKKYGKPRKKDPTIRGFVGTHKYEEKCKATGLVLKIRGYDIDNGFSKDPAKASIVLVDPENNKIAAGWSLSHFLQCWNKKHMAAVYVQSEKRNCLTSKKHKSEYRYGKVVYLCNGTGIERLLNAIIKKEVVYDPGDTNKSGRSEKPKARPQWRTHNLNRALPLLYDKVEELEFF